MIVLVCGGRTYSNGALVDTKLDELQPTKIVHGGARGADSLAESYADRRKIAKRAYPAAWSVYGRAAGPLRNQKMLDWEHPDLVLAFPGGSGTADMVSRARRAGVPVVEVSDP